MDFACRSNYFENNFTELAVQSCLERAIMAPRDQTDMGGMQESFLTTHWSLIDSLQTHPDQQRSLIGLLLERYWKPVYCYIRRKGYANEAAKDLTQGFFHEIVLQRGLVQRADSAKGRFRSFLLHALDQYLIDQQRRESTQKRIPKSKLVPFNIDYPPELPQTVAEYSPEDCFAYVWKTDLLERTLAKVQNECELRGQSTHWSLFADKVLGPTLYNKAPEPMKVVGARYGVANELTAFNMLLTVKRRFKTVLRQNLACTVSSEDDIEAEWRDILRLAGKKCKNQSDSADHRA